MKENETDWWLWIFFCVLFIIGASAIKSWEKSIIFRYGLPEDFTQYVANSHIKDKLPIGAKLLTWRETKRKRNIVQKWCCDAIRHAKLQAERRTGRKKKENLQYDKKGFFNIWRRHLRMKFIFIISRFFTYILYFDTSVKSCTLISSSIVISQNLKRLQPWLAEWLSE